MVLIQSELQVNPNNAIEADDSMSILTRVATLDSPAKTSKIAAHPSLLTSRKHGKA